MNTLRQEISCSFDSAFPNRLWLWVSIAVTTVLSVVALRSGFQGMPAERTPLYYLLSAQAETLGSLVVLAFSFTLVAAQIASRYSHVMLGRVIGAWALWYAVPFGVGILLPLFLLRGSFFLWSVHLSLIIAVYCVVSLVPYTAAVRRLLSISEAMADMTKDAARTSGADAADVIRRLGDISLGALNLKDYETFVAGVREILACGATGEISGARVSVAAELRRLIVQTSDERFASEALCRAMFGFGIEQGIEEGSSLTAENALNEVAESYRAVNIACLRDYSQEVALIERYADVAILRGERAIVSKLQLILYVIGERIVVELPSEDALARQVLSALGNTSKRVLDSHDRLSEPAALVRSVILAIERIGVRATGLKRNVVGECAIQQLQRLASSDSGTGTDLQGNARASIAVLQGEMG